MIKIITNFKSAGFFGQIYKILLKELKVVIFFNVIHEGLVTVDGVVLKLLRHFERALGAMYAVIGRGGLYIIQLVASFQHLKEREEILGVAKLRHHWMLDQKRFRYK